MVSAEDVITIYRRLAANGIEVWLTGGWGVDALLGEVTRPHKDLDVIMLLEDVARMRALMASYDYGLKELWSENRWVIDGQGERIATAFVLHDGAGREIDAHAMRLDESGRGIPAWEAPESFVFEKEDLSAAGRIAGQEVRCVSAEMQMLSHTGYELPAEHSRDLELLRDRFGLEKSAG